MAEFSKLVITSKGQALIAKIMTGIGNVQFTKVSTSDTECVLEQLEALTELSDVHQTVPISKISRTNDVAITIEAVFNNLELTEGYHMRALGLYAADPDEGEILYAVTMEISGNCYMPAYNGITVSEAYIRLVTTVGNAANVSLEVDLAAVATVGDLKSLRKEVEATYLEKEGNSKDNTVEFSIAGKRENIKNGEKHETLFGKIARFFEDMKRVAFSGSYNDLSDKPSIPATAQNGRLTIQRNGVQVQTFTADQGSDVTANIEVPSISHSAAVTQAGEIALDAIEKNASINGTLAHKVEKMGTVVDKINQSLDIWGSEIVQFTNFTKPAYVRNILATAYSVPGQIILHVSLYLSDLFRWRDEDIIIHNTEHSEMRNVVDGTTASTSFMALVSDNMCDSYTVTAQKEDDDVRIHFEGSSAADHPRNVFELSFVFPIPRN